MAKKAAKKKAPAKKPASKTKKASARRSAPARRAAAPKKPSYKPAGVGDVIANLILKDAAAAIDFYKSVFGARELRRFNMGGKIGHAELRIGDTTIFLNDESPMGSGVAASPEHKSTFAIQLYVPDVDATYNRALQAGARSTMAVADMFWGDRMSSIADPFGQLWAISTRVKHMTDEEMTKAGEDFMKQMAQQGGPPPTAASGG